MGAKQHAVPSAYSAVIHQMIILVYQYKRSMFVESRHHVSEEMLSQELSASKETKRTLGESAAKERIRKKKRAGVFQIPSADTRRCLKLET